MQTSAAKRLRRLGLTWLAGYFAVFFAANWYVFHAHPGGATLWLLAALPAIPIFAVIVLFGQYLRDETDEYKRDLATRCLLWGTAGALAVNFFAGFLHIFGWHGQLPPFTEFFVFAVLMIGAKLSYRVANRAPVDA